MGPIVSSARSILFLVIYDNNFGFYHYLYFSDFFSNDNIVEYIDKQNLMNCRKVAV